MKLIATHARFAYISGLLTTVFLTACTGFSPSIGISFPIGGMGAVGVSVGTDGRVGGTVGVGVGGASVNVGTSGQLPMASKTDTPANKTDIAAPKIEANAAKAETPASPTTQ